MSLQQHDWTGGRSFSAMDRRQFLGAGVGMTAAALLSCGTGETGVQAEPRGKNILIVYLTRTGNTEAVAEIIRQEVGGEMVSIELETPYPEGYDAIVSQVDRENERGYVPPLRTQVEDIREYETVFLGFPTWDMQLPPPMKSFLHNHDLRGKTVIPFNTNGGYGVGSSFRSVEELCPESDILEGFSTRGGLERDGIYLAIKGERRDEVHAEVRGWLERTHLTQKLE
jgi:flavodoxin